MKTLRCISTVVLSCLFLAAPASAAPSIHLSLPESAYLGSAVTATVSGESEATRKYDVRFLHAEVPAAECGKEAESKSTNVYGSTVPASGKFETSVPLPTTLYEALGTYTICATVQTNEPANAETHASLTVVTPPPPPPPAPAATPVSGPAATIIPPLAPVSKPLTAAQKLHAALAKCKHQKNKRKRVKCERAARRTNHR